MGKGKSSKKHKQNSTIINKSNYDCEKCEETIEKTDKKVNCERCAKSFHVDCVAQTRKQLKDLLYNVWFCSAKCKTEMPSPITASNAHVVSDDSEDEGELEDNATLSDVIKSVKYMSSLLEDLVAENRELKKIMNNYHLMETKVNELESEMEILKQIQNDNMLIITGIPEKPNEDMTKIVMDMAVKLDVDLSARDVIEAKRLKTKVESAVGKYKFPPLTLVNFSHPIYKNRIMKAKKDRGPIYTKMMFDDGNNSDQINVRSFLTPHNTKLLGLAKTLKDSGYKHIWFSNNKIQVRKDDGSRIIHIKSKTDIDNLIKNTQKKINN